MSQTPPIAEFPPDASWAEITADIDERERKWRAEIGPSGVDQVLEWPAPIPFDDFDLPAFPVEALPPAVQPFVRELSVATQTPVDLPALITLSALSTATAKRAIARVKPGYTEPLNLFAAVVLGSGERKTAVFNEATAPLLAWETQALEAAKPRMARDKSRFRVSEKRLSDLEARLARTVNKDEREKLEMEVEEMAIEHAKLTVCEAPKLFTDDCTQEALASLLCGHDGRMSIMSDEGGIFSLLAGRYTDQPNLDVYLKAHAGSIIRVDRKGQSPETIESPALTIGLTVQPSVMDDMAKTQSFRGTGLLARFLFAIPRGRIGYRDVNPPTMREETRNAYHAAVARMLAFSPGPRPLELGLDTLAFQAWRDFSAWLEPQLQEFENLGGIRDWGSKLPGAVARIAGVFALVEGKPEIDLDLLSRAAAVGRYLIPHAAAAFAAMGLDPELEAAKALLRLIRNKHLADFTKRDLFNLCRGRQQFKSVELLEKPLEILTQRNYLRRAASVVTHRGGRKSERYESHPHALR